MFTRNLTISATRNLWMALALLAYSALGVTFVIATAWVATPATAQEEEAEESSDDESEPADDAEAYEEIRELPGTEMAKVKGLRTEYTTVLRNGKAADAAEEKVVDDYTNYLVAELTWKENRTLLPQKRDELRKRYLFPAGAAPAPDMHDRVNKKLLDVLQKLAANERFHPAVRLNAMLIVADLNQQEPKVGTEAQPMPEAFAVLLATATEATAHPAIRAAALRGLARHAASNLSADARKNLVPALLELVKDPAAAGSGDGGLWMRMVAAQILGDLSPSPETSTLEVGAALIEMAAQTNAKLPVRCEAAYAIGQLDAKAFAPDKVLVGAHQIADLSLALTRLGTSLAPAPKAGAEAKKVVAAETDAGASVSAKLRAAVAIELQYGLTGVKQALVGAGANLGLRSAADDAAKQFIDGLVVQIDALLKVCSDSKLEAPEFAAAVRTKSQELESWLGENGARPGGAAPAAAKPSKAGAAEVAAP